MFTPVPRASRKRPAIALTFIAIVIAACAPPRTITRLVESEAGAATLTSHGLSEEDATVTVPRDGYIAVLLANGSGHWSLLYPRFEDRTKRLSPGEHQLTFRSGMRAAASPITVGGYRVESNCFPTVAYETNPYGGRVGRVVTTCRGSHLTGGPVLTEPNFLVLLFAAAPVLSPQERQKVQFRLGRRTLYGHVDPLDIADAAAPLLFGESVRAIASAYRLER